MYISTLVRKISYVVRKFVVECIHILMQKFYKLKVNISTKSLRLKEEGFLSYEPDLEALSLLNNSKKIIEEMFEKAERVSENPPVNQHILDANELKIFTKLISKGIKEDLLGAYSLNFICLYAYILEYLPHEGVFESSHAWHTDGYPKKAHHHKLFFYLGDCDQNNGAFEYYPLLYTSNLLKKGFVSSYPARLTQNPVVTSMLNNKENINIANGKFGSAFIFNPSVLIHRGGTTLKSSRRVMVFELIPFPGGADIYINGGYKNFDVISSIRSAIAHWIR